MNQAASLLLSYVHSTSRHIFLTGKAGTGKTTLLREVTQNIYKNTVVAAPTGVAAINAGGVTLHSLFQLPFGAFIPTDQFRAFGDLSQQMNTPKSLTSRLRLHETKRKLIREMELLIIDEVSMLRADILDEIDTVLRYVRRKRNLPFGGVQLLFIGDLQQLPPVVNQQEWQYLADFYGSPFFFEAFVLKEAQMVTIELDHVYRQADERFIGLLNRLRDNQLSPPDYDLLQKHVDRDILKSEKQGFIHITTHNRIADRINEQELGRITEKTWEYRATIEGKFEPSSYPMTEVLQLKEGAQVMFIKNDPSGKGEFYNGKIGKVHQLSSNEIKVKFEDGSQVKVERYTWENKKYKVDQDNGEIYDELIGQFSHYPLRLAWAITVHKSQGLTFEKAILDLSQSFAPGQMYVALSRLTSLDGLVLSSDIPQQFLVNDPSITRFNETKQPTNELEKSIQVDQFRYLMDTVTEAFNFSPVVYELNGLTQNRSSGAELTLSIEDKSTVVQISSEVNDVHTVGLNFIKQINQHSKIQSEPDFDYVTKRLEKAQAYFTPLLSKILEKVFAWEKECGKQKKNKELAKKIHYIDEKIKAIIKNIKRSNVLALSLLENKIPAKKDWFEPGVALHKTDSDKKKNKDKTPTKKITFMMYQEGKTIAEIATERNLAESTIAGHLAHYVAIGELEAGVFVPEDKIKNIQIVMDTIQSENLTEIKSKLGDEYSYTDIRFARAHADYLESKKGH